MPLVFRSVRLSRVLNHPKAMLARKSIDGVHIGRKSVEMHRNHRCSTLRDGSFKSSGVQIVRFWIGFDENHLRANMANCECCGEISVRRNYYLAAVTDVARH